MLRLWLKGLHSFEVVCFVESVVIEIAVVLRIFIKASVPSNKGIVKIGSLYISAYDFISANVKTIINYEGKVLFVVSVDSGWCLSATEAFLNSVFMNSPHTVNAFMNL
jgi:hypothetical protein